MDRKLSKRFIIGSILILAVVVLFGIIFVFSEQNAEKSGTLSRDTMMRIADKVKEWPFFRDVKKGVTVDEVHHFIRKLAHFSLYMMVGILLMSIMSLFKLKEWKNILIALAIGVLYAISDEFHQWFIPGRDARVTDVMIDTCGVLIGIGVVIFLKWLANKCMHLFKNGKRARIH